MTFFTSHVSQTRFTAPDTWCLEKHKIPTVSEFNEIRRGSYISRDDSNGEVLFIIRDLEKFWILTKITILPFSENLNFLGSYKNMNDLCVTTIVHKLKQKEKKKKLQLTKENKD